jgi:hypothetical protein
MRSLAKPHTSPSPSSPPLKGGETVHSSPLEGSEASCPGRPKPYKTCKEEGEGALLMNSLVIPFSIQRQQRKAKQRVNRGKQEPFLSRGNKDRIWKVGRIGLERISLEYLQD